MMTEQSSNDSLNDIEDKTDSGYDYLIKVLLLGESGVGKTCFLHQYMEGEFRGSFVATVGVDFRLKKMDYEFPNDKDGDFKCKIHLQLWDTAGQERYRSLTRAFFRDGMGFLVLFDLSSEKSFLSVQSWLSEIKERAYTDKPDILLVGNKSDLEKREVSTAQAEKFARQQEIGYIETSAKSGENVAEAVDDLLELVMKRITDYSSKLAKVELEASRGRIASSLEESRAGSKLNPEKKQSSCPC